MKPPQYRTPCILTQSTPYEAEDVQAKKEYAGAGHLEIGRVIWVSQEPHTDWPEERTIVYAEGIVLIRIETTFLNSL